ncbi:ataxin-3-like protein [Rhinopithecus roxellana]|uniref:ataxin-3-like protein n=1 Tax=Rhinopithecus roxellana TaxID=61622 RepID=UPI00053335C5|nr:ataxin-3-like protein [Rhinopithecus roxellana]XP_010370602.1 ataxin-3-like protein [Rhinopithecus roxellana]
MDFIFHEKQEGFLCAQHCLNNLLQGEYFSPVELASIAHQLDEEERMRMAEGGVTSEDYRAFLQQPSENMDDSGFFSIQWFNLNSLLAGPELISDICLANLLTQLQQEAYSVFVVKGDLPDCEADQLLQIISVEEMDRPKLNGKKLAKEKDHRVYKTVLEKVLEESDESGTSDQDELDFQRALELSRQETNSEDEDLRRAIELSMQGSSRNTSQDLPGTSCGTPALEEPKKIKDYFEKHQQEQKQQQQQSDPPGHSSYLHERLTTSSRAIESDLSNDINEDMVQATVDTVSEIMRKNLKIKGEK